MLRSRPKKGRKVIGGSGKASWGLREGDELVPGRTVLAALGGGARFEVFLVADEAMMATAVAKVLRPDRVARGRARDALRREAEHLQSLAHPTIVRMFDAVLEGPRPHLLLEHLEGPTLRRLIRRYGPLPMEQAVPLAIDIASALHYLHGHGLVHLDVKPANVLMSARPILIDLSVARPASEAMKLDRVVGSTGYVAPEVQQMQGVGPAADVWSFGAALWEATTGHPPPDRGSRDMPQVLIDTLMACLEPQPDRRPAMREVAGRLEPLLGALPRAPVLRHGRPRLA